MADYTPDSPYVIGNEWVPIKDDPYNINVSEELGTTFELVTTTNVVSGAAYGVDEDGIPTLGLMMAVYPEELVDQTGPIKQVVIQCNGATTVTNFDATYTVPFPPGATVAQALASAYDDSSVLFRARTNSSGDTGNGTLTAFFDVNSHTELTNARILNVEVLYRIDTLNVDGVENSVNNLDQFIANTSNTMTVSGFSDLRLGDNEVIFTPDIPFPGHGIKSLTIGDANLTWNNNIQETQFTYPWNYSNLQKFDFSHSPLSRIGVSLSSSVFSTTFVSFALGYMALRITYCEENRLLVGGNYIYGSRWAVGRNLTQLRTPVAGTVGDTLPPGRYAVTATRYTLPAESTFFAGGGEMNANAITELYPMQRQRGVVIPSITTVGATRVASTTSHLMELSLHTSSAAVTGVHPYGTQVAAPVWSGSVVEQGVYSSNNGSATDYPVVRFYARHLPDTVDALTIRNVATPAIAATITVDEFDQLDEIVDGWKAVTLRFPGPVPSFDGAGGLETYEWISSDLVGNQWQILSTSAPVITGSFPRGQLTGPQALDEATYGGSAAHLIIEAVDDTTSDATIMFAQEMPAVSGLAVQLESLPVSGIGTDCLIVPNCIPTGISYNQLTWAPLNSMTMPASGFGYYELQRSDAFNDWQTILQASSPEVTGFADYEARVGMESSYRIRFNHRLNFPSAWSTTATSTIPAPGVMGTDVSNGVLIFTTNEVQDGSRSLAYAMQWESEVTEGFTFLEAAELQLQRMYGRDFQVAFRPLERGGTQFDRMLLVQAAAVPTGLMQQGFTSLRDLAWEDVSYICVRDELGDRWLANVNVPEGRVRKDRSLYMANISITEVSQVPSIVTLPESS